MMNIIKKTSPNYDDREIPVQYLVLHYTATDLEQTLAIFLKKNGTVSSHLVIDRDGTVYELVSCLEGKAKRARHAGPSQWADNKDSLEAFNDFAIGIELINYNGNLFDYTDAQYNALNDVLKILQQYYPALLSPGRVLGHEQVSGFRGKADPGLCFDWLRFYQQCFPGQDYPDRIGVCPVELQITLERFKVTEPQEKQARAAYWVSVSSVLETSVRLIQEAKK